MDSAAVLLGDEQSITLRDEGCLQLGVGDADFTISLWFRVPEDSGTEQATLIGNGNTSGSTDGFTLYVQSRNEELVLGLISGGGPNTARISTSGSTVEAGEWNHVSLIRRNRRFRLLLNAEQGDFERVDQDAYPDLYREKMLRFGDPGHGTRRPVELSEARSYQRALGDTEVRALYLDRAAVQGLSAEDLDAALTQLNDHVQGDSVLEAAAFEAAVAEVVQNAPLLPTREAWIERGLDVIEAYELQTGPLFVSEELREITQTPEAGESAPMREARGMLAIHQAVFDYAVNQETVAGCGELFQDRAWQTSSFFPGALATPVDAAEYTVPVDATKPMAFGRPVAFATNMGRRATGLYLPPGSVGQVTVPSELVNRGFAVLVGAHSHTQDNAPTSTRAHRRMPGVARRFEITNRVTPIANPLGGGIYIEVPYLADGGLVDVTVSGVVEAPFFSLRSFDRMTAEDWQARRTAPGPWVDFVTDRFMMQVPRHWVYAIEDPTAMMEDWDRIMDGFSELMGILPEERNELVLYLQPDVWIRHGMGGIGYPQINNGFNASNIREGNHGNYFLTDPVNQLEMHELGHAQLASKFRGESEAWVNFPMAYVLNQKFDVDFDEAFARSGPGSSQGGQYTPDQAAIHWMITENFRNGQEMNYTNSTLNEMRYQHRGYAKYADVARLFGWEALRQFSREEHLAYVPYRSTARELDATDDRILRMSIAAEADLTPLIHFWGIQPVDPEALQAAISANGLEASDEIQTQLRRYRDLIPVDNTAFNDHYEEVYPGRPAEGGNPDYAFGWYNVWRDTWDGTHAQGALDALDAIIALYFP